MLSLLVLIALFIFIIFYALDEENGLVSVKSNYNGIDYRVRGDQEYKEQASFYMSVIDTKIKSLNEYMKNKYYNRDNNHDYNHDNNQDIKEIIDNISANYTSENLFEIAPINILNDTSYIIDKGKKFVLCLREKDPTLKGDPNIYDIEEFYILMFVALHELSHIAIPDIDHTRKFWKTFKILLENAEESGIYTSPNFIKYPKSYCGMTISYSPLYDKYL